MSGNINKIANHGVVRDRNRWEAYEALPRAVRAVLREALYNYAPTDLLYLVVSHGANVAIDRIHARDREIFRDGTAEIDALLSRPLIGPGAVL